METTSATATGPTLSEVKLSGRGIAPGLGMGQAWVVGDLLNWNGPPTRIGLNNVDGELVGSAPATFRILPRRLKFIVKE